MDYESDASDVIATPAPTANKSTRTALWVALGFAAGFLIPVCSCALLFAASFLALGQIGGSTTVSSGTGDAVAIVRVEGVISSGDKADLNPGAVSGVVIDDLKKAAADPAVKAILLRVDSPGGAVTGVAQIYEMLQQLEKPVVVSMSSLAASGGYYVSAPADYIFARPDTITGSLGVIMSLFNAAELIDDLGVEAIAITSGPNKTLGSVWETLTPAQREILEALVDESYDEFVRIVAEGRSLSREQVMELADGRIYSGRQALQLGLVDELGNLEAATQKAAELGGISGRPRLIEYEHIPSLGQLLMGFTARLNKSQADQILETITEFATPSLEYRYIGPGAN
jgi:protease-4